MVSGSVTIAVLAVLSAVIFHVAEAKEIAIRNKDVPQYQEKRKHGVGLG